MEPEHELLACLARIRELRGEVTSAAACREAALDLEVQQQEFFAASAQLGGVQSSSSSSADSTPALTVQEQLVPDGVVVGDVVLATGLHAGQRMPFRAVLMGVRNLFPPLLVRYTSTLDGRTLPLLLPEIRDTYLPSSEVSKFDEAVAGPRSPRSAKTRGQQATAVEDERASKRKRPKSARAALKRVRFADEFGNELPPLTGMPLRRSHPRLADERSAAALQLTHSSSVPAQTTSRRRRRPRRRGRARRRRVCATSRRRRPRRRRRGGGRGAMPRRRRRKRRGLARPVYS